MDTNVRDCLVTGYEDLIPALTLPDPDDRHVLAAAIRGRADVIVTFNLKDFPADALADYGIEAQHPDEFLTHQLDLAPARFCGAVKLQRLHLKRPPVSAPDLLTRFEQTHLLTTAAKLREYIELI